MKEIQANFVVTYNEEHFGVDNSNIEKLFDVDFFDALKKEMEVQKALGKEYVDPSEWVMSLLSGVNGNLLAGFAVMGINAFAKQSQKLEMLDMLEAMLKGDKDGTKETDQ